MNKVFIKRFLSVAVVISLTASVLSLMTKVVRDTNVRFTSFDAFYEKDRDYDVLFFGSSHPMRAIYPMELWKDYGIASYNGAVGNGNPPSSYWTMMTMLEHCTPKLVVFECLRLAARDKASSPASVHSWMDSTPLSKTKLEAIDDLFSAYDLFPNYKYAEYEYKEAFVWDFIANHYRWSELTQENFSRDVVDQKGGVLGTNITYPSVTSRPQIPEGQELDEETAGIQYARMIIEECKARGIEVMLTFLPFVASETEQREANTAARLAEEYGLHYLNFLEDDPTVLGVDYTDGYNHLNASGARKVTSILGQYIMDHYDIPDRREDQDYAAWNDDYSEYTQYKLDTLGSITEFKSFLMLLYDKNFSSCIYLTDEDVWHDGSIYDEFLKNINVDSDQLIPGCPTLVVIDNMTGDISYLAPGESMDSSFGRVALTETDGKYGVDINGNSVFSPSKSAAAGGVVINKETGAVGATSQFSLKTTYDGVFVRKM